MSATTYHRPTEVKIANREAWLMAAAERLWGDVIAAGGERPKTFRISCGWPSKRALATASSSSRRIGEAWAGGSDDGAREVFISPALADEVEVMAVALHELIHAALPADAGHGPAFQSVMKKVRLGGKPTATVPTDELVDDLRILAHELGRYPHAKLDAPIATGKPGRMVKGYCPDCQTILYGSRAAWEQALPVCGPCGTTYVVEPSDAQIAAWGMAPTEAAEALENVSTMIELRTRDRRFVLQTTKTGGREGKWTVTDYQAVPVQTIVSESGLEVVEHEVRWTYRENRADALAFIAAIRSGELEWDDVEDVEDEAEWVDEEELGEVGDWSAEESDLYLDEDEDDETDDELGEDFDVEEYERVSELREASGARTSQRIIEAGGEGAMD